MPDMRLYQCMVLGGAIGDTYGYPIEMMPREIILKQYPGMPTYVHTHKVTDRPYTYSDDTQMTISVLHFIADDAERSPLSMLNYWLRYFEPWRGYSSKTYTLFTHLLSDPQSKNTIAEEFRTSNGGLMRVSPLVKFALTVDCSDSYLMDLVRMVHYPTHMDPETCWVSLVFIRCLKALRDEGVMARSSHGRIDAMNVIKRLSRIPPKECTRLHAVFNTLMDESMNEDDVLNHAFGLDGIAAVEAFGAALCCIRFHINVARPCDLVKRAIEYGGDCDTIASLVGQLAGIAFGDASLDPSWLTTLENRKYLEDLATAAFIK